MTKQEIENRIAELNDKRFMLAMADHWDDEDYRIDREWHEELQALNKQLETLGRE